MTETTELRLILAMAPSFQGGHSKIGGEVSDYLSVPFPLNMKDLDRKAKACGFDPYDLWPWMRRAPGCSMTGKPETTEDRIVKEVTHAN